MGVDLVGLAGSTAGDEFADEGGHPWPPIIFLKKGDSVEVSTVSPCEGFMDVFDEGVLGGFGDVEAQFVVKGALIKVPVLSLRTGKGYGVGVHCGQSVNDKLVRGGGFSDLFSKSGIEHIDV